MTPQQLYALYLRRPLEEHSQRFGQWVVNRMGWRDHNLDIFYDRDDERVLRILHTLVHEFGWEIR